MLNIINEINTEKISGTPDNLTIDNVAMQLPRPAPLAQPTGRLQLRFWGTRGSIPVSGAEYLRYGGNTSCVSLSSNSGHLFIFDCGSGARNLGNYLLSDDWTGSAISQTERGGVAGYILLSHTHWDHIQGFPFFGPVFQPDTYLNVVGWSDSSYSLAKLLAGQMNQHYFPVSLYDLPAHLNYCPIHSELVEAVHLDGAKLTTRLLKHPLPSLGYRLELGGKTVVYASDQEPHCVPDPTRLPASLLKEDVIDRKLVELAQGADILIHDAQYNASELVQKVGWGHSSAQIAVDTAIKAGVKRLVLFHHDPSHDDRAIDLLLAEAYNRAAMLGNRQLEIIAASDGLNLEF